MRRTGIACALLLVSPALVAAADRTLPMKPEESACVGEQLGRLQRRLASSGSGSLATNLGLGTIWIAASSGDRYQGIARQRDFEGSGYEDFVAGRSHFRETQLAFELLFSQGLGQLDPRRVPTSQATLVRRDDGTNLTMDRPEPNLNGAPGCCVSDEPVCAADLACPQLLHLDLSALPGDSLHPANGLLVNSSEGAPPELSGSFAERRPSDDGRGAGIERDGLARSCGGALTSFDRHVFEILARTIAPSGCYSRGASTCRAIGQDLSSHNITIFRGPDPHVYRIDLYGVQYACDGGPLPCFSNLGPIALEARINWDSKGRLTSGSVRVLPECAGDSVADCSDPRLFGDGLGIFLLRPIFAGHEEHTPADFHGAPYLYASSDHTLRKLSSPVDWQALLAGTGLNSAPSR